MNRESEIEKRTNARIVAELTPADVESLYCEMLDECYPELTVGYCTVEPSRFLREFDPVGYRCGQNDYVDGLVNESLTDEIEGEHYNKDEADAIRDEVETEVDEEIEAEETEREEEEAARLEEEENEENSETVA